MNKTNIIIIALAALSLTGCKSLYGNYNRPSVKTSGIVRDPVDDKATLDGANDFGNLPWRSVFTDPQLQQLIEKALNNNPDLLNATLNVDIAEQQVKAANLSFLPSVSLAPSGTISQFGSNAPTKEIYTLPIAASWEIDLFGKLRSSKKAAQMTLMQVRDYKVYAQTNLVSGVANLYYTLLMLYRQNQIVTDMLGLTKNTWDVMKLQMEFGRARSTSVQSAEAAFYNVQTQAADIRRQIRETENSLSLLLGEPAQMISRGSLDGQMLPNNFSGGVDIQLLSNRADVHANEMALAQCFYNVQTARSRFYPSIIISPSGAWTNNGGMVNPGKILLNVVGSLTQPVFMRGQLIAGLRVAQDKYKQAYNTWQNSILKAGSEISNALVAYNSADEKERLRQQQINVLKKNVEQVQMLYKQSSSTYLEVITAQQNLLNAEISQVKEQFTKIQSIVNLYKALGGGAK